MKLIFIFLAIVLYLCMIVSGDFAPHIPFGLVSIHPGSKVHLLPAGISSDGKRVELGVFTPLIGQFDDNGYVKVNGILYLTVINDLLALSTNPPGDVFVDKNGYLDYPKGKGFLARTNGTGPLDVLVSHGADHGNTPIGLRIIWGDFRNPTPGPTAAAKVLMITPLPGDGTAESAATASDELATTSKITVNLLRTLAQVNGAVETVAGFGAAVAAGAAVLLM